MSTHQKIALSGLLLSNLGCEGILRGTIRILRTAMGEDLVVRTPCFDLEADRKRLADIEGLELFAVSKIRLRLGGLANRMRLPGAMHPMWSSMSQILGTGAFGTGADAMLLVGGDVYVDCGTFMRWDYLKMETLCSKRRVPFVVWGANFETFPENDKLCTMLVEHFRRCALITARDDYSVQYLREHGIAENVNRVFDPAFAMRAIATDIEPYLPQKKTELRVGLNLSRVAQAKCPDVDLQRVAADAIGLFIERTGQSVVLVCHVFTGHPGTCDRLFHRKLYKMIAAKYRPHVGLADEDIGAPRMKYLISQLDGYAGARMHSTIAAFSSAVPVLSLSYSGKAVALNKALLGDERWVLPVSGLTPEGLCQGLLDLLDNKAQLRDRLQARMPEVEAGAFQAGKFLSDVIGSA